MNIFWRVYFAHLLSDFTLQTEQLVKWKREKAWGLAAHVLIFFIVGSILTVGSLTKFWPTKSGLLLPGWGCLLILSAIHFLLDNSRIQIIAWRGAHTDNLFFFLLDQVFHLVAIYLFTSSTPDNLSFTGSTGAIEKWVIIACLAIFATYFTNIFLYYFGKTSIENSKIKVHTPEKHYSLIERLLILFVFLLPGKWWFVVLIFLPLRTIVKNIFLFNPQGHSLSSREIVINYSFAIICGILARLVYYL